MSVMTRTAGSGLHVYAPYDEALIATVHDATANHIAPARAVAIRAATESLDTAVHLARRVETDSAMINEDSNFRIDRMPSVASRDSGTGRKDVRYEVVEFAHRRLVALSLRPPRWPSSFLSDQQSNKETLHEHYQRASDVRLGR
jgi:acyl-CoA reductase-like NAD-dependent aldehyde dehydrogenase